MQARSEAGRSPFTVETAPRSSVEKGQATGGHEEEMKDEGQSVKPGVSSPGLVSRGWQNGQRREACLTPSGI